MRHPGAKLADPQLVDLKCFVVLQWCRPWLAEQGADICLAALCMCMCCCSGGCPAVPRHAPLTPPLALVLPPCCDPQLKTNCYCFALDRFVGSYCEPGLGGTGKMLQLPGAKRACLTTL